MSKQSDQNKMFRESNEINREQWKKSGVVKTIKWFTAEDEKVCEICKKMNKKVVDVEDLFDTKSKHGSVFVPQEIHPDCRCYLRPQKISND